MKRLASLALAALLAGAAWGCTQHHSSVPPASSLQTPSPRTPLSPSPVRDESQAGLVERLRSQPGIFEGVPYPRLRHWSRESATAYADAFDLCDRIGVRDLSIQLDVRAAPAIVATAILEGFDQELWRAAHQGCVDGLIWDTRAS